jgi:amino acid adenylation domain-containing protein
MNTSSAARHEFEGSAVPGGRDASTGRDARRVPVPRAVERRAAERPNALALSDGARRFTYRELDASANRLAYVLAEEGAGRGEGVALALPRSPELTCAALAAWKAGAAYVPLDVGHPDDRLRFMLMDSGARVLVTTAETAARLSGPWKTVAIDAEADRLTTAPGSPLGRDVSPDDLAYIVYTSGTTGRPKGVEIAHQSLSNLVAWHVRTFAIGPDDRTTQLAGPAFDAAVWETWPALAADASLHLPDEATRVTPALLRDWLVAERITVSFLPTPLAEAVLALAWPAETALRILLTGGDTLHKRPPQGLPFALVNNYGPAEATVVATSGLVAPDGNGPPTIGHPIDGVTVRLLGPDLSPVPDGEVGELCIGGVAVARGYRGEPALTAQKFVPDPLDPSARLYRSGDLARHVRAGQYAFLGRNDGQLEVKGVRVEADELVSILDAHPAVAASAVAVHPGEEGPILVAYVVPAPAASPTREELSRLLASSVPAAVLPEAWVALDALPLTPNGKLDRAALPAPSERNALPREDAPAASPMERRLVSLVAGLLGVPEIGLHDNFFLAGGHSMMGTQLIARVRDAFGVDLSLRTLFASPTAAGLAAEVTRRLEERLEKMSEEEALELLTAGAPGTFA